MNNDIIMSDEFDSVEFMPLVEKDIDDLSIEAKDLLQQKTELEIQKKQATDQLKDIQNDLETITRVIAKKARERSVVCQWEINFLEKNKRLFTVDDDTGEKIYLRKTSLTPEDMQLRLGQ